MLFCSSALQCDQFVVQFDGHAQRLHFDEFAPDREEVRTKVQQRIHHHGTPRISVFDGTVHMVQLMDPRACLGAQARTGRLSMVQGKLHQPCLIPPVLLTLQAQHRCGTIGFHAPCKGRQHAQQLLVREV